MITYNQNRDCAIIVLHEIYGINLFMKQTCAYLNDNGYDVYCPDLYQRDASFSYDQTKLAYDTFMNQVGFDAYQGILRLIVELKHTYAFVFVIGYSVGATLAWRCSESPYCDGVLCYYGSRIRDYLRVVPVCPTLMFFAKKENFDVQRVATTLMKKENVNLTLIDANHGFLDPYGVHYAKRETVCCLDKQAKFLTKYAQQTL